jgi:hypothetical protein
MKMHALTTTIAAAVLGAAALASASTAAAVPTTGSAADVVKALQEQGYNVQFNGATNGMLLARCTVSGLHGLTVMMTSDGSLMMKMEPSHTDTVYVDLACPDTNN